MKNELAARLQRHPKRVVFPEGSDPRVLQVARQFATMRLGIPILVGNRQYIKIIAARLSIRLEGIRIVEPERSEDFDEYKRRFRGFVRAGMLECDKLDDAAIDNYVKTPSYFSAMMVLMGAADAMVCGVSESSASALRPVFQLFPRQEGVSTVSSMQIMDLSNMPLAESLGAQNIFLADCTVLQEPTAEQLADIAVTTAILRNHLTNERPKVAFLSYTTRSGGNENLEILKIREAVSRARTKAKELGIEADFDGDFQADVALDHFAAASKNIESSVAGCANVLVFPDLMSAKIASRFAQAISGVPCYGQIMTGLKNPVAEISRGASVQDILGATIIVAAQAVDKKYLFPMGA
ncbi:MAG: phosphate acetyltransferase [Opitutales bacterium]|nr:phosphate acetyltransferase [Opitutales bacterium]